MVQLETRDARCARGLSDLGGHNALRLLFSLLTQPWFCLCKWSRPLHLRKGGSIAAPLGQGGQFDPSPVIGPGFAM